MSLLGWLSGRSPPSTEEFQRARSGLRDIVSAPSVSSASSDNGDREIAELTQDPPETAASSDERPVVCSPQPVIPPVSAPPAAAARRRPDSPRPQVQIQPSRRAKRPYPVDGLLGRPPTLRASVYREPDSAALRPSPNPGQVDRYTLVQRENREQLYALKLRVSEWPVFQFVTLLEGMCNLPRGELISHDDADIDRVLREQLDRKIQAIERNRDRAIEAFTQVQAQQSSTFVEDGGRVTLAPQGQSEPPDPPFDFRNLFEQSGRAAQPSTDPSQASSATRLEERRTAYSGYVPGAATSVPTDDVYRYIQQINDKAEADIEKVTQAHYEKYIRFSEYNDPMLSGMLVLAPSVQAAVATSRLLARRYCARALDPDKYIKKRTEGSDQAKEQLELDRATYASAVAELIKASTTSMPSRFIPTQLLGTAPANQLRAVALLRSLLGSKFVR